MGQVIVFGGEKGGGGKSTLAINIAVCLTLRGLRVLLIDGDKQRTTVKFCDWRAALARADGAFFPHPSLLCMERRGDMFDVLETMREQYDFVIVDVAGAATTQLTSAVNVADRLFTPLYPSEPDLNTAETMNHVVDLARAGGNRELVARFVLNCVDPRVNIGPREIKFAHEQLEPYSHNYLISSTVVYTRGIMRKAYSARKGVVEIARSPLAKVRRDAETTAGELWALCDEVMGIEKKAEDAAV